MIEKYILTSRRKVVEDVCEFECAITNPKGWNIIVMIPTMCHRLPFFLPRWVPSHHLRPSFPRQRSQRSTITTLTQQISDINNSSKKFNDVVYELPDGLELLFLAILFRNGGKSRSKSSLCSCTGSVRC